MCASAAQWNTVPVGCTPAALQTGTIIGEFRLGAHRYLVLAPPRNGPERQAALRLPPAMQAVSDAHAGRLSVDGVDCLVVEIAAEGDRERAQLADLLTQRELQIATLVALGHPTKQIAHKLHISEW